MGGRRAFSVSVFARRGGRVLLIRHARLNAWLPVGGEIEEGETPLEAARRELREETGLEGRFDAPNAIDGAPSGLLGYEEHAAGAKGLHLNFAFVADVDGDVTPNHEFEEFRWIDDPAAVDAPANVRQLAALALAAGPPGAAVAEAVGPPGADVAEAWIRAFNARDLDALLALYADDAVHSSPRLRERSPETRGEVRGKPALRAWWSDALERTPGLRYELRHLSTSEGRVILEYDRTAPGEPDQRVAETLQIRAGRIIASRVHLG